MKVFFRFPTAALVILFLVFASGLSELKIHSQVSSPGKDPENSIARREEAYRANNIGVALLEQFNHKEAAESFRKALSLDPGLKPAQINLAIALFNVPDYEEAIKAAQKATELAPQAPQPTYILGLIARTQNRTEDAVAAFKKVLEKDPQDVGSNVNLGQVFMQERKYAEAVEVFQKAVEAEPYNSTAVYNLATALLRDGKREQGQEMIARFQTLRQSGAATSIGLNYLEQGRYAEAVTSTGAEPELVDKTTPNVVFRSADAGFSAAGENKTESKSAAGPVSQGAALFDFDGDGDQDLVQVSPGSRQPKLFRNDAGKFTDITKAAGDLGITLDLAAIYGIVAGDYDNDSLADLLFFGSGQALLFRNEGNGQFKNVTAEVKLPKTADTYLSGAFLDSDHDGDLDIFLAGFESAAQKGKPAPHVLFQNNGNGTFTDISAAARLNVPGRAVAVIPTDFDNRRDIDLLVLSQGEAPQLWQNLRDGTFRNAAERVGLSRAERWTSAAAGDFNKDTFTDFFFGREGGAGVFAVSDGRGGYKLTDAPCGTENAASAQFLDFDNDGLLDLVVNTDRGFAVARNLGGEWTAACAEFFKPGVGETFPASSRLLLSADTDTDGDIDLLAFGRSGALEFFRNEGANANRSEIVRLAGRVSSRSGTGAKIDMRSGSLTQKLESYAASPAPAPADIHFGLGKREKPDALRVIWTSGVIQAEIEFPEIKERTAFKPVRVEELDRKPSSCPYLYAWNGEKFEFITDFLGGGEMAYSFGNGQVNTPDPDEYVRITSEQLKPKNGKYELRITNELEEVLFLDRFELTAIDHPADAEVYPNEGLGIPTAGKFILYTTKNEKPVLKAVDGSGRDVTEKLKRADRDFYDTFESEKIRGYAKPHELILTLDDRRGFNGRTLLLLTGWTDYAFSSDNVAAAQAGISLQPPKLQVKNKRGEWQTVIESMGFSVGRPQTVVVDLTGKFLSASREVRILTNMKTLWDKAAVDVSEDISKSLRVLKLDPQFADLRERGFSLEVKPDGKEPVLVDYDTVLNDGRWKYFSGDFTRTGDVLPLLSKADDVFVISKTGDEIAVSFDESALPPLRKGMKRTFLLYSVGYSKEMDVNSASPDAVHPLPFRAMKKYPYGTDERFPMTEEMQKIYDEYTTRRVRGLFPRLETALLK